jgi:hypothetical protein
MKKLMLVEIMEEQYQYGLGVSKARCLDCVPIEKESSRTRPRWREALDHRSPFGGCGLCD